MSSFSNILTAARIKQLADSGSYQRGEAYFRQGHVHSVVEQGSSIVAEVEGSETYQVEFWLEEDNELGYQCDCPVGVDGWFCKHCVAVGLAWLGSPPTAQKGKKKSSSVTTLQDVQRYLEQQDQASLVKLIVDRALKDSDWREQLLMKVAATQPKGVDVKTFQRALQNAIVIRGYLEYGETRSYARKIEKVLDSIAALLDDGHAQTVMELCEYAIPLLEDAVSRMDDSNGDGGAVLEEIQDLHYRACEIAKPDPIALAERLFEFELGTDYDTFYNAVDTYQDILGEPGLARYQQLAEAAWQEIPTLTANQQRTSLSSKRWRLTRMMESLAEQTGDIEAIVAIKRRDLSSGYHYFEIAELYQQDGQSDRALQWAEDGLKAFPDRPDSRLREFVIQQYQQRGRFDDAMTIVWACFTERPALMTYQTLKTEADCNHQWSKWRERALKQIRQRIEESKRQKTGMLFHGYRDHSLLVEIFLWEGETESAWQEAKAGGCSKALWIQLANQREPDHPEDSLSIYMNEIEPLIQQTNNNAYAEAVGFLKKARSLMLKLSLRSQFDQYQEHLRSTYKNKRNFIKLLNEEKL
ncbi:DUF6880 family protein [Phormidesmis sp. 146-35]